MTRLTCGRRSCDDRPLKCERVCTDLRCLNPDHCHPQPSPVQRAVFSLPWLDLALWCCMMGAKALRGDDRNLAATIVMAALRAACRGDRSDPALAQPVRELNGVAMDLLSDRYAEAQSRLDCIVSARLDRALEIDAQLELADLELIRLEEAACSLSASSCPNI